MSLEGIEFILARTALRAGDLIESGNNGRLGSIRIRNFTPLYAFLLKMRLLASELEPPPQLYFQGRVWRGIGVRDEDPTVQPMPLLGKHL